jgi:hypothetical protein
MKELPSYIGVFIPGLPDPVALFNAALTEGAIVGAGTMAVTWASSNLIHYEIRDVWIGPGLMLKSPPWTGEGTSR